MERNAFKLAHTEFETFRERVESTPLLGDYKRRTEGFRERETVHNRTASRLYWQVVDSVTQSEIIGSGLIDPARAGKLADRLNRAYASFRVAAGWIVPATAQPLHER